jgi:adenylosuccinate lyase
MMKNLNMTGGLVFSQRILLELPLKGLSREDSYIIVQRNAMKVWEDLQNGIAKAIDENNNTLFLKYLLKDEDLLKEISKEEIKQCFDYSYYTKNIDSIFKRVF